MKPTLKPLDIITLTAIMFPVLGAFYPLDSYLSFGSKSEAVTLPIPLTAVSLVVFSLFVVYLYLAIVNERRFLHDIFAYAFVGFAFLTLLWSENPNYAFLRALRLLPAVGLGLVVGQFYSFRKILYLLTICCLICGVVSILLALFVPSLGIGNTGGAYTGAWRGVFNHKNYGAFSLSLGMIVATYAYLCGAVPALIAGLTFVTCGLTLFMAESATAMAALLISGIISIFCALFRTLSREYRLISIVVFILVIAVSILVVGLELDSFVEVTGRDVTFTGRTYIWSAVWYAIENRPFTGYGYGFWGIDSANQFNILYMIGDMSTAHSHNSWLDVWLQCGVFGVAAVVLVHIRAAANITRNYLASDAGYIKTSFCISVLVFVVIRSMFEVQLSDPAPQAIFWVVMIGSLMKVRGRQFRSFRPPSFFGPARRGRILAAPQLKKTSGSAP